MSAQQPQPQAPNPLRFTPDAALLGALFPEPHQQQAFMTLLQGLSNHNLGIVDRFLAQQEAAFNEKLAPLDAFYQQEDTNRFYDEIARAAPELADHMDTVRTLQLKPELGENPTRADLVKAFANAAKGQLSKYVPSLQTQPDGVPQTPTATPTTGGVKPVTTTPPVTPPQPGSNSATRPSVPPTPTPPVDSTTSRTIGAADMAAILEG